MKIKSIIVVLLVSLSVVAQAQTPSRTLTAQTGTQPDAQQAKTSISARTTSVDQPQPAAFVIGWNYGHVVGCQPYFDGTWDWLYVFTAEGPTLGTPVQAHIDALLPACQSGNLVGFYVTATNGSSFSWSSIVLFSYK